MIIKCQCYAGQDIMERLEQIKEVGSHAKSADYLYI